MGSMREGCDIKKGAALDHDAPTEAEQQRAREQQQKEQRKEQMHQREEDRRAGKDAKAAVKQRDEERRIQEIAAQAAERAGAGGAESDEAAAAGRRGRGHARRRRGLRQDVDQNLGEGSPTRFFRAEDRWDDDHPTRPFAPDELKTMLDHSFNTKDGRLLNEVLVDTQYYLDRLPESAAAIFFFHDASMYDRVVATKAYVGMLDAYNLTESQFHLLKINHRCVNLMGEHDVMSDESAGARHFLATHPYGSNAGLGRRPATL